MPVPAALVALDLTRAYRNQIEDALDTLWDAAQTAAYEDEENTFDLPQNFGSTVGVAGLLTAAAGLKLGSGTAALDTYEEGSCTPTLIGSTTPGTQTYLVNVGRYIRIGDLVALFFAIALSAKGGTMAGLAQVGGLPFATSNISNMPPSVTIGAYSNLTLTAGKAQLGGVASTNTSAITLIESGSGVAQANLTAAAIANNTALYGTLIYRTGT